GSLSFSLLTLFRLSIFLSSRHPAPLPPHSFPTRRSSDLHHVSTIGQRCPPMLWWYQIHASGLIGSPTVPSTPPRTTSRHCACSADRKSTRLNSSHGSISYAVFCLKKKQHPLDSNRCPEVR